MLCEWMTKRVRLDFRRGYIAVLLALFVGCLPACQSTRTLSAGGEAALVREVAGKLAAMPGAEGRRAEADAMLLAEAAVRASREQAVEYRAVRPAGLHNCLVNTGFKERGLCWHWMEDLYPRLRDVEQSTYHLVAGVRDEGLLFSEHHCVVVVVHGRPYEEGLVLDPWVKGGRLVVFPVEGAKSPWEYDPGWTQTLERRYRGEG